ncbi:MAG: DUF2281 domain-containing protein [Anaerolineales bacterium]|nr:DUF2281 domain-containing protein [Anaerolineales bacterium]
MRQDNLWQNFNDLPPEAQKQVMDFISFLQARYKPSVKRKNRKAVRMRDEAFIGIWRGREDIQDSVKWVRDLR